MVVNKQIRAVDKDVYWINTTEKIKTMGRQYCRT